MRSEECHMTLAPHAIRAFLLAGLAATLCSCPLSAEADAEEIGHRQFHDSVYRHWTRPGTSISCCSDQDCGPVVAEFRQGQWYALRQSEWFTPPDEQGPGEWLPLRRAEWIAVPEDRIIRVPNPTVEGAHLCYSNGTVVCFVPPNTGG
jgi:hypothetical protein